MGSTFFFVFCVGSTYNISVKSKSDEYEDGGLKWIIGETEIGNPEPIPPSAVCKLKILCRLFNLDTFTKSKKFNQSVDEKLCLLVLAQVLQPFG